MIKVRILPRPTVKAAIRSPAKVKIGLSGEFVQRVVTDPYEGDYTITPSDEEQIIPILGKTATKDIKINPIPSNYGLISWNGSTLTVS